MEHTVKAYSEELNNLTAEVVRLGGLAEAQVADSIIAFARRDLSVAQTVIERDEKLDALEADIDGARNAGLPGVWLHRGRAWPLTAFQPGHTAASFPHAVPANPSGFVFSAYICFQGPRSSRPV